MASSVTIAYAVLAVVPAAIVFFTTYGRYDGTFRDNVVFLYFMGGLVAGGVVGFISLLILASASPLLAVVFMALLTPIAFVAAINRRKWQGERHAVFNGGAFGLGVAVMVSFSFLFFRNSLLQRAGVAEMGITELNATTQPLLDAFVKEHAFTFPFLGQMALVALGLAGLFFGLGLLAGDAVRRRAQMRAALAGTAIILAPVIFLEELFQAWNRNTAGAWLWCALLAAYGIVFGVLAERRLLIQGVSDEARRQRRRRRRARAPE